MQNESNYKYCLPIQVERWFNIHSLVLGLNTTNIRIFKENNELKT